MEKVSLIIILAGMIVLLAGCNVVPGGVPTLSPESDQTALAQSVARKLTELAYQTLAARLTEIALATATFTSLPPADTLAPSPTPSQTSTLTYTSTLMPTSTFTATSTPSQTPTLTPTLTPTSTITFTATPTSTLTFTPTSTDTPSPTPLPCYRAEFIRHVDIPPYTSFKPGSSFTKSWRLLNTGTCNWSPDDVLVFVGGDRMDAPTVQRIGAVVYPGEVVDVAVKMTAPAKDGIYTGKWKLRSVDGTVFGMGEDGDDTLKVVIRVRPGLDAENPLDFAHNACAARWFFGPQELPCPGSSELSASGSVYVLANPVLEGGYQDDEPAIILIPGDEDQAAINGRFPAIKIKKGDRFTAVVGCLEGNRQCSAVVRLYCSVEGGEAQKLLSWVEVYDGEWLRINQDLSSFAGKSVEFIFWVKNNGSNTDDRIFWLHPQIRRK